MANSSGLSSFPAGNPPTPERSRPVFSFHPPRASALDFLPPGTLDRNAATRNGNLAIRHLGIPTVTVPMGTMADIGMPVGLTFAGAAYSDAELLRWAAGFESLRPRRTAPPRTPEL